MFKLNYRKYGVMNPDDTLALQHDIRHILIAYGVVVKALHVLVQLHLLE